jgi:Ca2+-binding EF-hand superfamily protein
VHHFQPNFTHGSQEGSSVRSHTPPDPYPERPTDVYYPSAIAQPASGVAVGNGGVKFANGELRRQSLGNVEDIEDYIRNSILGWYKTLEEAFDSMDIDKDGLIDSNEFADALKTSFGMDFLTRLETTALMSRFDTDGDGYIDGEEFLRFIRKDSVPEGPVDQSIIDQTIAKFKNHLEVQFASMRDAFRQLDDDRNGSISKQEFATVLKNFDIKVTDSELDALVQRYDTNNDGRVSHTEFLKVMAC